MAGTVPPETGFRFPFNEDDYPVWKTAFDADTRRALIEEDLRAGTSVSAVLVAVVTTGALIGIIAVVLCVATL